MNGSAFLTLTIWVEEEHKEFRGWSETGSGVKPHEQWYEDYCNEGWCHGNDRPSNDPAATYLPLVLQTHNMPGER